MLISPEVSHIKEDSDLSSFVVIYINPRLPLW